MSWHAMPTNAPVKLGVPGAQASSERMLASNCCGSQRQSLVHAFDAIREVEPLEINLHAQMHGLAGGNRRWAA